jgi:hypothetical protein
MPAGATLLELARGEGHDLGVVSIHAKRGTEEIEEEAAPEAAAEGGEETSEGE